MTIKQPLRLFFYAKKLAGSFTGKLLFYEKEFFGQDQPACEQQ